MSAAAAGRDTTLQLALDTLHDANYDVCRALQALTPNGQPVVKLDEMESWSASEGNLFEEALEKYGKCFYDIQSDFLPWKHPKSLIEFYYMWKTTDHYIQQKRLKAAEAEHHLKQVYIPNYNKPNPAVLYPASAEHQPSSCEGCKATSSVQWFALGPATAPLKVCTDCWNYWKRYGDLKFFALKDKMNELSAAKLCDGKKLDTPLQTTAPSTNLIPLNRQAINPHTKNTDGPMNGRIRSSIGFYFNASSVLRLFRRLHPALRLPRLKGRRPFELIQAFSSLQSDLQSFMGTLDADIVQRYKQRLQARLSNFDPKLQSVKLEALLSQLFPTRLVTKALKETLTKTKPSPVVLTAQKSSPVMMNGLPPIAETHNGHRKRPAHEMDVQDGTSNVKKPNLSKETQNHSSGTTDPTGRHPLVTGPRRRMGMGPEENGASTLMFLATDAMKRNRRKLLTISELRRHGRRPSILASPKKTGLESSNQAIDGPSNDLPNSSASCPKNNSSVAAVPKSPNTSATSDMLVQ